MAALYEGVTPEGREKDGSAKNMFCALRKNSIVLRSVFIICGILSAMIPASAIEPRIELIAATCAGCHGNKGSSAGPATPTISGGSYSYFILAMDEYLQGKRNSTIMTRIAKGYTWPEIQALAAYFAAEPFVPVNQTFDKEKARRGKVLHARYCESCHQNGGRVAGASGVLSGQMTPYLKAAVDDMLNGKRIMPRTMKRWMDRLIRIEGENAIDDLLNYYATRRVY